MSRYQEALNYIPGGVNSPVRAFKSVDRDPIFIKKLKDHTYMMKMEINI